MPTARQTLENLKAFFEAEMVKAEKLDFSGTRPLTVYVHTTFYNWLVKQPRPGVTLVDSNLSISSQHPMGPRHVVSLCRHPRMGYPTGTYVYARTILAPNGLNQWMLRKVGPQEGRDGFLPRKNLVEHRYAPISDESDLWAIVHWVSDPDRWPHIAFYEKNLEAFVFRFHNPDHEFEFKNAFDV